jgi:hypothetical protein
MIDRYTKFVLSVIAIALVALASENYVSPALSGFPTGLEEGCGSSSNPCYIYADSPLAVRVMP